MKLPTYGFIHWCYSHLEEPPSAVLAELERRLGVSGLVEKATERINMIDCLFCKIRDGEIPADIIYKDNDCLAFRDVNPKALVHFGHSASAY